MVCHFWQHIPQWLLPSPPQPALTMSTGNLQGKVSWQQLAPSSPTQRAAGLISDIPACRLTQYCSPQMAHVVRSRALPPAVLQPRKERRGASQVPSFKSKGYSHHRAEEFPPRTKRQMLSTWCAAGKPNYSAGTEKHAPMSWEWHGGLPGYWAWNVPALWRPFGVVLGLQQSWICKEKNNKQKTNSGAMTWQTSPAEGEAGRQASVSLQKSWQRQEFSGSDLSSWQSQPSQRLKRH